MLNATPWRHSFICNNKIFKYQFDNTIHLTDVMHTSKSSEINTYRNGIDR